MPDTCFNCGREGFNLLLVWSSSITGGTFRRCMDMRACKRRLGECQRCSHTVDQHERIPGHDFQRSPEIQAKVDAVYKAVE
jgi:hypothetical protein